MQKQSKIIILTAIVCILTLNSCSALFQQRKSVIENMQESFYETLADKEVLQQNKELISEGVKNFILYHLCDNSEFNKYLLMDETDTEDDIAIKYFLDIYASNYQYYISEYIREQGVFDGKTFQEASLSKAFDNPLSFIELVEYRVYTNMQKEEMLFIRYVDKDRNTSMTVFITIKDFKMQRILPKIQLL